MKPIDTLTTYGRHIPFLGSGTLDVQPIHKGYSKDQKYLVVKDQQKYLLRTFSLSELPQKQTEFDVLSRMQELQVACSKPVEFGRLEELEAGYMVLTFVEGEDAAEALASYSAEVQFQIGLNAGAELKKMHGWQAPAEIASWYDRKAAKHQQYVRQYEECSVKIEGGETILSFINSHLGLMKGRPNLFQHDDYHPANLVVHEQQLAGVIDFNRWDWGDPIHEFLKVGLFSTEASIPFSVGQIVGYHGGQEPDDAFWKLYALYVAMSLISSIVWIRKVKPEETDDMLDKIYRVLEDHRYFELNKPQWYNQYRVD